MTGKQLEVTWRGTPAKVWGGMRVIDFGDDAQELLRSCQASTLIAVDPGQPSGVACFPYDRGYPITLHTVPAEVLAAAIESSTGYDIVCETPLHGSVRVYDPWPWKVRGFLELISASHSRSHHEFIAASVGWLTAGKRTAQIKKIPYDHRHSRDALAYAAMAVLTLPRLRARQAEHLGDNNA